MSGAFKARSRPPPWLIYPGAAGALLLAALAFRPHADAPAPPPLLSRQARTALAQATPFDTLAVRPVRRAFGGPEDTAFAIGDGGLWLAPAQLVRGCKHPAILVGGGRGVTATARSPRSGGGLAVLTTPGGAPALPLAAKPPAMGSLAYVAGYVRGRPGEVAMRLIGPAAAPAGGRRRPGTSVLAWAAIGRTEGLGSDLTGLVGAPALDEGGRVVGVVLGWRPRRGRIYAAAPDAILEALRGSGARPPAGAVGQPITRANYDLAADDLRRSHRVVGAICANG